MEASEIIESPLWISLRKLSYWNSNTDTVYDYIAYALSGGKILL